MHGRQLQRNDWNQKCQRHGVHILIYITKLTKSVALSSEKEKKMYWQMKLHRPNIPSEIVPVLWPLNFPSVGNNVIVSETANVK